MKRQKERKYRNERQQDNWRMEGKAGGECTEPIFRDDSSKFYEQEASNNIIKKHYKQKLLNYEEKIPKPPEKHALFTRATKRPPAKFIQPRDGWASPSSHAATLSPMSPPAISSCGTGQEQDVAAFRCWTAGRAALTRKQVTAGGVATVWRGGAQAEREQSPGLAELDRGRDGKPPMLCMGHRVARARGGKGTRGPP